MPMGSRTESMAASPWTIEYGRTLGCWLKYGCRRFKYPKGYSPHLIVAAGSWMDGQGPLQRGGAARRVVVRHRRQRPCRSSTLGATGHGGFSSLAQIDAVDTRILTRWSWTAGMITQWLTVAVIPFQALRSMWGTSKASPVAKLDVRWWWLSTKLVDHLNCFKIWRKIELHGHLVFQIFLVKQIRALLVTIYMGSCTYS
jgi:hypothetical protein